MLIQKVLKENEENSKRNKNHEKEKSRKENDFRNYNQRKIYLLISNFQIFACFIECVRVWREGSWEGIFEASFGSGGREILNECINGKHRDHDPIVVERKLQNIQQWTLCLCRQTTSHQSYVEWVAWLDQWKYHSISRTTEEINPTACRPDFFQINFWS